MLLPRRVFRTRQASFASLQGNCSPLPFSLSTGSFTALRRSAGSLSAAAALLCGSLAHSAHAEEIPFPEGANVGDHFFVTQGIAKLEFNGEGRLSFLLPANSKAGATHLALLSRDGGDLYTEAEKVSAHFRLSPGASLGFMLKASDRTSDSYLIIVQPGANQRAVLRICKVPLLPLSGLITEKQLKAHAFAGYDSAAWHQLVITLKETGDAVLLEAQIIREDGTEIAHLLARDANGPLVGRGLLGLRFYMPPLASDGFEDQPQLLEVKNLNVHPIPTP